TTPTQCAFSMMFMGMPLSPADMIWFSTVLAASTRSCNAPLVEAANAVEETRMQKPREASVFFMFRNPFLVAGRSFCPAIVFVVAVIRSRSDPYRLRQQNQPRVVVALSHYPEYSPRGRAPRISLQQESRYKSATHRGGTLSGT